MKKGQRPSKHYRRVRTKKGKKRVHVNPSIPKKIKKHKTQVRGTIKKDERKVFRLVSDPKYFNKEYGGAIDFDLVGEIENINIVPGTEYAINLPEDFEVQWHGHPDDDVSPPTPDDVISLLGNKNQQAEIIFRKGKAFIITKTKDTETLSKLPTKQLYKQLDKAFLSFEGKNWERDWKKYLESLGFIVNINNNPHEDLNVEITPIEPKVKKRKRYSPWASRGSRKLTYREKQKEELKIIKKIFKKKPMGLYNGDS